MDWSLKYFTRVVLTRVVTEVLAPLENVLKYPDKPDIISDLVAESIKIVHVIIESCSKADWG